MAQTATSAGPHDWGLFGPGSVTWKVNAGSAGNRAVPFVPLVGGLRALLIQTLDPHAMAGVAQHSDFRTRGMARLRNTSQYVAAVDFGDTTTARRAAARVRRVHEHVKGHDPVTGTPYSAADPDDALWVHTTEIHSFLAAYRAYGGRLSDAEQDRYLAEQVSAAELLGIPRSLVPASRADYRDYFASARPRLCVSAQSREAIDWVLAPELPGEPPHLRVAARLAMGSLAPAVLALVPQDLRRLMRVGSPRALTVASAAGLRAAPPAMRLAPVRGFLEQMIGSTTVALIDGALANARLAAARGGEARARAA